MKKHFLVLILCILVCFSLCSCDAGFISDIFDSDKTVDENANLPENSTGEVNEYDDAYFLGALSNVTSDSVVRVYADDYDFDGIYEAYVMTSKKELSEDTVHSEGISLWFIKNNKATLLCESADFYLTPKTWEFSDKVLFCVDRYAGGADYSNVFFVSGSGAYSYGEFSARLERISENGNDFFAFVRAGDTVYKVASHSYQGENIKPYYLYFDGNFFCEYAGLLIKPDDLKVYSGAEELLNAVSAGTYTVGDIFYRSNGIINMNISKDGAAGTVLLENVTLKISDGSIHLLTLGEGESSPFEAFESTAASSLVIETNFKDAEQFSFGGLYSAVAFPGIAVYPESAE